MTPIQSSAAPMMVRLDHERQRVLSHLKSESGMPQDQPIEALAAEMKGKSLGEKLSNAIRYRRETLEPRFWNHTSDAHKADFEQVALAFAASLSHDETATAVIAALSARLVESEAREAEALAILRELADENGNAIAGMARATALLDAITLQGRG